MNKRRLAVMSFVSLVLSQPVCAALEDGLVAYYPFEGNANDASGNERHATALGGVSFESGVAGSAARFDGSSGRIQLNDADIGNLGANATVAFWFYAEASNFQGSEHRLIEKEGGAFWIFGLDDEGLAVRLRGFNLPGPAQAQFELSNAGAVTERWTAVALRKTGGSFGLFLNGSLAGTRTALIGNVHPSGSLSLGGSAIAGSQHFAGLIDEVAIYDRALSSAEIAQLAASLPVPEPKAYALMLAGLGLVAHVTRRRRT